MCISDSGSTEIIEAPFDWTLIIIGILILIIIATGIFLVKKSEGKNKFSFKK